MSRRKQRSIRLQTVGVRKGEAKPASRIYVIVARGRTVASTHSRQRADVLAAEYRGRVVTKSHNAVTY